MVDLHALVPADHVYRDAATGKYVVAGTFHHVDVPSCPATFGRSVGVFVSLGGVEGEASLSLEFCSGDEVLMDSPSLTVRGDGAVQLSIEVPPLPLPRPGAYSWRLAVNGVVLGEVPLEVRVG